MEIEIKEKIENPLLNRTEVHFDCLYHGEPTPKVMDVKNKLVALLDADKDLLVVSRLLPKFGEGKAEGYAKIYDRFENLKEIEQKHVLDKNTEPQEGEE
ncbi:MAG: 30S ribosomal protein S24e [Methanobacterium sp.]|jgi:small subunit ribosomal protein S24e